MIINVFVAPSPPIRVDGEDFDNYLVNHFADHLAADIVAEIDRAPSPRGRRRGGDRARRCDVRMASA